jgi:hypothetical protein
VWRSTSRRYRDRGKRNVACKAALGGLANCALRPKSTLSGDRSSSSHRLVAEGEAGSRGCALGGVELVAEGGVLPGQRLGSGGFMAANGKAEGKISPIAGELRPARGNGLLGETLTG